MKIRTSRCDSFHPRGGYSAVDDDNRHMIGYGATEQEAIDDLKRLMNEAADWAENSTSRRN